MRLSVVQLGADVPYDEGMAEMRARMASVDVTGPTLLLLEHTPTLTVTRHHGARSVFATPEALAADGIALVETDRGGDVTFHGPGQLVGYPVLRLCEAGTTGDLVGYVHALEDGLVQACVRLGVQDAHRVDGQTGVWCNAPIVERISCGWHDVTRGEAKLIAIGVGVGRGVTRHGFALNITTDLEHYTQHMVPCGLTGRAVTSLERVLSRVPPRAEIERVVVDELSRSLARFLTASPPSFIPSATNTGAFPSTSRGDPWPTK
jgi:lipoyl(octanoyl) transferase